MSDDETQRHVCFSADIEGGRGASAYLPAVVVDLDLSLVLCLSAQLLFPDRVGMKTIGVCQQQRRTQACCGEERG